jgi:hypothetical protein
MTEDWRDTERALDRLAIIVALLLMIGFAASVAVLGWLIWYVMHIDLAWL